MSSIFVILSALQEKVHSARAKWRRIFRAGRHVMKSLSFAGSCLLIFSPDDLGL